MANIWVTVGYGIEGEQESEPIVAAFSSAQRAKAWAFSQTKNFENVHAYEMVIDAADGDKDWDDICSELY